MRSVICVCDVCKKEQLPAEERKLTWTAIEFRKGNDTSQSFQDVCQGCWEEMLAYAKGLSGTQLVEGLVEEVSQYESDLNAIEDVLKRVGYDTESDERAVAFLDRYVKYFGAMAART